MISSLRAFTFDDVDPHLTGIDADSHHAWARWPHERWRPASWWDAAVVDARSADKLPFDDGDAAGYPPTPAGRRGGPAGLRRR